MRGIVVLGWFRGNGLAEWYVPLVAYTLASIAFIIISISAWIIAVRLRRRIKNDLGEAPYEGDLTSIETWMKVDEVEEKAGAGPSREWVPKPIERGFQITEHFAVVRPFEALETLSGRKHRVLSGQAVTANLGQSGPNVTIELNSTYLVVDFLTFSNCCERITETDRREIWP